MQYKRIVAAFISCAMIMTAASCGTTDKKQANTSEAETTATTTANIKVKEGTLSADEGTATTTVTTITEVVSAPTETDSLTETPEEDDFSGEDAVNLMLEAVRSMADEDFDKMLQITNFGDVCRIAEDNSGNLTDEEILKEIKENKDSFDMTEWRENAETMRNMTVNDIDEPVRMSQEDIKDITNILESMSHGKRTIPEYVDGYKASFFNSGDIAHMYVFKGTDGVWRYDICFGMMRDGLAQLGVQNFSD